MDSGILFEALEQRRKTSENRIFQDRKEENIAIMRYWKLRKQGNGILRARPGITIIESIILMMILGIIFGAVFSTAAMAQRAHGDGRQRREARELLFNWIQNFESTWVPDHTLTIPQQNANVMTAIEDVQTMMGGTTYWAVPATHISRMGMFNVTVHNNGITDGALDLNIIIAVPRGAAPPRAIMNVQRRFNVFSNETVRRWD